MNNKKTSNTYLPTSESKNQVYKKSEERNGLVNIIEPGTQKGSGLTILRGKRLDKNLTSSKRKQLVTYKGLPIQLSADFSTETMQARREWQEIFEIMNNKNLQPRLLYPAKPSFRIEGQMKSFTDKKKLKEFTTTKPVLYNGILKGIL